VSITPKITFKLQKERWHLCLIIRQRPLEAFIKPPQHLPTKPMLQRNHFIEPSKSYNLQTSSQRPFSTIFASKNQSKLHALPASWTILRCINYTKSHKIYLQQLPHCPQQKAIPNQNPLQQPPLSITAMIVKIRQEHWHYRLIRSQRSLEPFTKPPQHLPTKTMLQRNHFIEPSKS
jgi:hypothetical protein